MGRCNSKVQSEQCALARERGPLVLQLGAEHCKRGRDEQRRGCALHTAWFALFLRTFLPDVEQASWSVGGVALSGRGLASAAESPLIASPIP